MPRNGSGTYSLPAGNPVVTGTVISSTVHNNTMSDIADELTNSVDKDGQTVITGDLDLNGNAIILDVDADSTIEVSTDDRLDVTLGGVLSLSLTSTEALKLDAIAALAVTDGNFIVGNGTTFVAESGSTVRTSLGVDLTTKGTILAGNGTAPAVLAPGTNGYRLNANSATATGLEWVADPQLPGLQIISTATASASAAVDFTGITSSFDEYQVHLLNVIPATDGAFLTMRTSTDGGSTYDSSASDYRWQQANVKSTAFAASRSTGSSAIQVGVGIGNQANEYGLSAVISIIRPSEATYCTSHYTGCQDDGGGDLAIISGAGQRLANADVDAIRFLMSSGNIASGIIKLYGVIKS